MTEGFTEEQFEEWSHTFIPGMAWCDTFMCHFNAISWFQSASDEQIKALMKAGFKGEAAIAVARFLSSENEAREITIFVRALDNGGSREISVDPNLGTRWIRRERPHLLTGEQNEST